MFDPSCVVNIPPSPAFQLKDVVTATIALAALVISLGNVWVAYLRPRRITCNLSDTLRISYSKRPEHLLRFLVDIYALNTGAKPGVITRMRLELWDVADPCSKVLLQWREFMKSENIAAKGTPRRVWTTFNGFASSVLIPKYDARLIEAVFFADNQFELRKDATYRLRVLCWLDNGKEPIISTVRTLSITERIFNMLETQATANEQGLTDRMLFLMSDDGKSYTAPKTANFLVDQSIAPAAAPKTTPLA